MAELALRGVRKEFGRVVAVNDLSLDIPDRAFVSLLGPSGCGKSTTLNLIAGLEELTAGEIYLGERRIDILPPNRRDMSMVFQDYALYPHMTVAQNIAFSLRITKVPRGESNQRVREMAELLHIEHLLDRRPIQLSGGERQRVALGRALVKHPKVVLFDEPLSNLDAALRVRVRGEIRKIHLQRDMTSIFVTHDQEEAMTLSDQIAVMDAGRVVQYGSPTEVYGRPSSLYVATFIGKPRMNTIPGEIVESSTDALMFQDGVGVRLRLPQHVAALEAGRRVTAGIRPEDIQAGNAPQDDGNVIQGEVTLYENVGADAFVEVTAGANAIMARVPPAATARIGDRIQIWLPGAAVHLFDTETGARIG